jgi:dynein heavy chain
LFRLAPKPYPELATIGKEIELLSRLYDLYQDVLTSIQSVEDVTWFDADLHAIDAVMASHRDRCNALPKRLA